MKGQLAGGAHGGVDGSGEDLRVSVSFGRFEKDSLSWEKWSSFSPNKYLEEVDKCAPRGSVARKAAYFEAHYRRISARKAELLLLSSHGAAAIGSPPSVPVSSQEVLEEEEEERNEDDMITLERERLSFEVVSGGYIAGRVADSCGRLDNEKDGGSYVKDDLKEGEVKMLGSDVGDASKRSGNDDIIRLNEAADYEFTSASVEIGCAAHVEMRERIQESAEKLESWRKPHKTDPLDDEKIMVKAKKKPAPAVIKSPQLVYSTPRTLRPTPVSPAPSMTKSFRKPGTNVSSKRNKSGPSLDLKKVSPNNVYRPDCSLIPPSFDPAAIVAPRRSLIMERMGDKDIVRRAFKTFQNHVGLSKSFYGERSSAQKAAPSAVTGTANSTAIRKENMGLKAGTVIKKSHEVFPSPYGSRSSERAEKTTHVNKKPEQKSAGTKATPMPAFYRGQNKPLSNQRKMVKKEETRA